MKPHPPQRSSFRIHQGNYAEIRAHINAQIDLFLINAENWVLAEFRKLPEEPNPDAVVALSEWISGYLPPRTIRDFQRFFPD